MSLCRADHSSRGVLLSVGVSEYDHVVLIMSRSRPTRGCCAMEKGDIIFAVRTSVHVCGTFHEFAHYVEQQPALRPVLTRTQCSHLQPPIGAAICHKITGRTKTVAYLCHKRDALCTTDVHHHCQPAVLSLQPQVRRESLSRQHCRQRDTIT